MFAAYIVWWIIGNHEMLLNPLLQNDDVRTHIYIFHKYANNEAIAHDPIQIEENRFGIEPEIAAKMARGNNRIFEIGISYFGRTYSEGKKIGWKDGFRAIYAILKYNVWRK